MNRRLEHGFLRSWERVPGRPALEAAGVTLTYAELGERAAAIARTLERRARDGGAPLTAVFAQRSPTSFAGVLGALLRGHGYVPLNPRYPIERTRTMLDRSRSDELVVDAVGAAQLDDVLVGIERPLTILLPDAGDARALAARWPGHVFVPGPRLEPADAWEESPHVPDRLAYLLFTSGSTGVPKGVMVTDRNIASYVDFAVDRYAIAEDDRFSQISDLTFDVSVFDMFVAWERGACVCCPSARTVVKPDGFIEDSRLTVWFSVPSLALLMRGFGLLRPGRFRSLRWSFFAGEALPADIATAWLEAAPQSGLGNLYGPTELFVCTAYHWDRERSPAECERGIVPIGEPTPGMIELIVDDALREVEPGAVGELLMTGTQLTAGYWDDPARTAASYVVPPGRPEVFYRTGDLVRRPRDGGPLRFHGRADDQVKVLGHRVELGEVEAALRAESDAGAVAAIAWPVTDAGAGGIVGFLAGGRVDVHALRARVARRLPEYMVPRRLEVLDELPLNANGKTDRRALAALLEARG